MIYADNAATTRMDEAVLEAMLPYMRDIYGNASQPYSFARGPKKALKSARETIAACINAEPDEIFFTSGGSESDNQAIKGCAFNDPNHRAMITSAFEHHAILHSCAAIEKLGYPVAYMWPNTDGVIEPETLSDHITINTRMVSVMTANNELGSIQPIRNLAEITHEHGAIFHTDAVQAVGHIPVDVKETDVDLLSASAHKFNGPRGVGFLYIRKDVKIPPLIDGGAQENGLRAGTENTAGIIGMAAALKANCERMSENAAHLRKLEKLLLTGLGQAGINFRRNGGAETLPGVLSLSFPGFDGEAILHRMDLKGICISTGSACDSVNTEISHVLQAIRLDETYAKGTIRISLGKNNTEDEVLRITDALASIVR